MCDRRSVPVVLQSQALLVATVQKQLKIHRFSFLLWRLTRRIRVQRRVRQFHVFVIPTFSQPYCVLTSDPFGFLLYSSPRSSARFGVVASRQYDKDHDRIQQSPGTWHLRQVGALCIEGKFSSTTCCLATMVCPSSTDILWISLKRLLKLDQRCACVFSSWSWSNLSFSLSEASCTES